MEHEQTKQFNERLNQWIASQGVLFQLRHSNSGGKGFSILLYHSLKIGLKLLILLLVAAIGFGYYLKKRPYTGKFISGNNQQFTAALGAKKARLNDFKFADGKAWIRAAEADGGPNSFFNTLDANAVSFDATLVDGLLKRWECSAIKANKLVIDLRVGADSPEQAEQITQNLVREYPGFKFSSINGPETTIRWGLRAKTAGSIEGSKMIAVRNAEGWQVDFSEGTFSQNWLHDLKIIAINAQITPSVITIPQATFETDKSGGKITFSDVKILWNERPKISGNVKLEHVPLSSLIPRSKRNIIEESQNFIESSQNFIEGTVSGELAIGGSTNTSEGVTFSGNLFLDKGDSITMRDSIHLFKALSVVSGGNNNYQRVNFNEGSFSLKSSNGTVTFRNIALKSELVSLKGDFMVRPSTLQEAQQEVGAAGKEDKSAFSPVGNDSTKGSAADIDALLTLEKAGEKTSSKIGFNSGSNKDFDTDRQRQLQEAQATREASLLRELNNLRFDGKVVLTVPGNTFEQAIELRELYPVDPNTGKTLMPLSLEGNIAYPTKDLADKILELGKRKH
jgi:hypothetical protein